MGSNMAENHPVGFRFVMKAKDARRHRHPRRPALLAHLGDGRLLRAAAGRQRPRLPGRARELRAGARGVLQGVRRWHYTNAAAIIVATSSRTPRTWTACSAASIPGAAPTRPTPGRYAGQEADAAARPSTTARTPSRMGTGAAAADASEPADRPDAPAPALRLPDPQAALRALHAGDGRAGLRRAPRPVPEGRRDDRRRTPGASGRPSFAYAVAWTQHTTGTQIISCCAHAATAARATSGGRAAASWRCAATPRSRARTDIPTLYNLLPGYLPMPTPAGRPRRPRDATCRAS